MVQALIAAGYKVNMDVPVGELFGVNNQKIQMLAVDPQGVRHFITLMGQTGSGTTVQKIPFGAMALIELARRSRTSSRFHLVLYGSRWNFKDFFLSGGLGRFLVDVDLVSIVSIDRFLESAKQRKL